VINLFRRILIILRSPVGNLMPRWIQHIGDTPLGARIFSDRIWDVISEPGHGCFFAHGYTYSSHTVAAAAALKNIEIMAREEIPDHVREMGPYFFERLGELHALDMVGDVRGKHLMACVEFVKDKTTGETFPGDW